MVRRERRRASTARPGCSIGRARLVSARQKDMYPLRARSGLAVGGGPSIHLDLSQRLHRNIASGAGKSPVPADRTTPPSTGGP
jgi:hypothetical protein